METGKINYVEMPSRDIEATKEFFTSAFGWSFVEHSTAQRNVLGLIKSRCAPINPLLHIFRPTFG